MQSASTSETLPIGETGEEIPDLAAIFGNDDSNDITQSELFLKKPKRGCKYK